MSHSIKITEKSKYRLLDWILVLTLFLFVTSTSYNIWKDNDSSPVVTHMRPVSSFKYNSKMTTWFAEMEGVKQRNCVFIPTETIGMAKHNAEWNRVEFFFTNDSTPGSNRQLGYQHFDTWNWVTSFDTDEVKVIVKHVCNDSIVISTIIGPLKLK